MIINAGSVSLINSASVSANLRCPGCGQLGTFEPVFTNSQDFVFGNNIRVGERRCPNLGCRTLVFIFWQNNAILRTYPALRIDFDKAHVPPAVVSALEESITCHANECFIAAAIMVRKTLDELCRDRGAHGNNLKEQIRDLGTKIVLPKELLDGLDDLRLLGNDAAHIDSREYDQVGKDEVEVGIEFTKEVLKATYQYSALLTKLRGLKKTS